MPRNCQELQYTPEAKLPIIPIEKRTYTHFGIQRSVSMISAFRHYKDSSLVINVAFDGVPLFKSSGKQMWPLLGLYSQ